VVESWSFWFVLDARWLTLMVCCAQKLKIHIIMMVDLKVERREDGYVRFFRLSL
jgi:hypothetical protein